MKKSLMYKILVVTLACMFVFAGFGCNKAPEAPAPAAAPAEAPAAAPAAEAPAAAEEAPAEEAAKEVITIRLAHNVVIGGTEDQAANLFADLVKEKTNGAVEVQIYGGGQLGNERDMIEGLQMGTLDMCLNTSAYLSNIQPEVGLLDLPFLFEDYDDVRGKLEGKAGEDLRALLIDEQGIRVLDYWCSGFRVMLTKSAPINSLADLKGRKMRAPEVPVYIEMFQSLGAAPTPIPFGEVYTSINTGVVDGVEVCAEEMYTMKFHEVGNYICVTNHIFSTMIPVISEKLYQSLPAEYQTAIMEAAKEATEWEWEHFEAADAKALEEMEAEGITITHPTDREAFEAACAPMQQTYAEQHDAVALLDELLA